MRHITARRGRTGVLAAAGLAAAALVLAGCTTDSGSGSSGSDSSGDAQETLQVAYISFAVDNTYDAPMLAAAQEVAKANDIEITVFDGALDPATQATLIEDVIASGQYDGMLVQPVYGPAIFDVVKEAIDAGITVVNIDQILGDDFTSGATQLEGLSANVVFVGSILGEKFGQETVRACASKNLDPCNVAYLHDLKTSAVSIALWDAFSEVTKGTPVTVVAEGETFWNPAAAQGAVADILTANPDIDVIVSSDQGLQGAVLAIEAAGRPLSDFLMVGYGGSVWGQQHVADGTVFANVLMAPATTGRLGMEALVDALRNGNDQGDIDPFKGFPNNGVITKETADQFTGEWAG